MVVHACHSIHKLSKWVYSYRVQRKGELRLFAVNKQSCVFRPISDVVQHFDLSLTGADLTREEAGICILSSSWFKIFLFHIRPKPCNMYYMHIKYFRHKSILTEISHCSDEDVCITKRTAYEFEETKDTGHSRQFLSSLYWWDISGCIVAWESKLNLLRAITSSPIFERTFWFSRLTHIGVSEIVHHWVK